MPAILDNILLFISFSVNDQDLKDDLTKHLKILKRRNLITDWFDRSKIAAGEEPAAVVKLNLQKADIILLLISSDYISSDEIWEEEVESALARHDDENDPARVVPVILRPCNWQQMSFGKLQATPRNGIPVTQHQDPDIAFTYITDVIKILAEKIKEFKKKNPGKGINEHPSTQAQEPKQLELEELTKLEIDLVKMLSQFKVEIARMAEGSQKYYLGQEIEKKERELDAIRKRKSTLL